MRLLQVLHGFCDENEEKEENHGKGQSYGYD